METCRLKLCSLAGGGGSFQRVWPFWCGVFGGPPRRPSPELTASRLPSAPALRVTQGGLPAEEVV